ncbi:MAG: hypothetical protein AAGJ18_21590 [Bacteroidota bacterium]
MAKNTDNNYREGCVKDRCQFYNKKTGLWTKMNTKTNKIMGSKKTGGKYKGVKVIKKK